MLGEEGCYAALMRPKKVKTRLQLQISGLAYRAPVVRPGMSKRYICKQLPLPKKFTEILLVKYDQCVGNRWRKP